MFCVNCGFQLPENALYCPNCGNKIPDHLLNSTNISSENTLPATTDSERSDITNNPYGIFSFFMPYRNIILIIGCVLSIISVFLPYLTAQADFHAVYSVRLIQGDGFIYLGIAVALLVLVLMYRTLPIFILSLINFVMMIINCAWAAHVISFFSFRSVFHTGAGFVLLIISAIAILFCGILYFIERQSLKKTVL